MRRTIDLNADLGEGFPWDYALLGRVTSASVCCGFHAGDPETSYQTLCWAGERGVVVGAHPGYPDRENFGRRDCPGQELGPMLLGQLQALDALAARAGVAVKYVKPHGALYNRAQVDREVAEHLVQPLAFRNLSILCQPESCVEEAAIGLAVPFFLEGFADRRYRPDGRLVPAPSPTPCSTIRPRSAPRVLALIERGIDTICIHGDNPRSVELADLILAILKEAGVEPRSFA